jgi:hypothetical protein
LSSKEGNGRIPGVVTAEVGAVEYPTESSEVKELPYDPYEADPEESDMQETEPLPPVR